MKTEGKMRTESEMRNEGTDNMPPACDVEIRVVPWCVSCARLVRGWHVCVRAIACAHACSDKCVYACICLSVGVD
jgi:hypothetical protein